MGTWFLAFSKSNSVQKYGVGCQYSAVRAKSQKNVESLGGKMFWHLVRADYKIWGRVRAWLMKSGSAPPPKFALSSILLVCHAWCIIYFLYMEWSVLSYNTVLVTNCSCRKGTKFQWSHGIGEVRFCFINTLGMMHEVKQKNQCQTLQLSQKLQLKNVQKIVQQFSSRACALCPI